MSGSWQPPIIGLPVSVGAHLSSHTFPSSPVRRLKPAPPGGCADPEAAAQPQNTTRSASWMMRGNCATPLTDPNAVLVTVVVGALNWV